MKIFLMEEIGLNFRKEHMYYRCEIELVSTVYSRELPGKCSFRPCPVLTLEVGAALKFVTQSVLMLRFERSRS
jgi:hypothetical protein